MASEMLGGLFNTLTVAMSGQAWLALIASFIWGIVSILFSPCHLSSIPLIIGYISKQPGVNARRSVVLSLLFAMGILASIAFIGVVTAQLGRMLGDVGRWGNLVVAMVFLAAGLYLLDIVKFSWNSPALCPVQGRAWLGALILGLLFGIGLGPCTFAFLAPVLGVVFSLGAEDMAYAVALVGAFALGHCLVIAVAGSLAQVVQRYLNWTEESSATLWFRRLSGSLVLLGGAYFLSTMH